MTRDEYLAYAKARACEYIDGPQPHLALTSLIGDLSERPDMEASLGVITQLGLPLAVSGHLDDRNALRKFIDDLS